MLEFLKDLRRNHSSKAKEILTSFREYFKKEVKLAPEITNGSETNFIICTLVAGITGFVCSILIINYSKSDSPFFEYIVNNRKQELVDQITIRIDTLNNEINKNDTIKIINQSIGSRLHDTTTQNFIEKAAYKSALQTTLADLYKSEMKSYLDTLNNKKIKINEYRKLSKELILENVDVDSSFYTKYFIVDRNALFDSLNSEYFINDPISFKLILPELIGSESVDIISVNLKRDDSHSKVDFIRKHPSFGIWLLLSIAQMSLWFVAIAILLMITINTIIKLAKILDNEKKLAVKLFYKDIFKPVIIVILILIFFLLFVYEILIDKRVIYDHFFLEDFTLKMKIYSTLGYIATCICLTIYLFSIFNIIKLNNSKGIDPGYELLKKLKENIDYSFGFSALILSVFVIWVSVMFNAINSLELMDYYKQISGKPFLNNDFVILIGFLHSLLLLLFYIPVKIIYNSLDIVKAYNATIPIGTSSPWYTNIYDNLIKNFSPILITTSPLITSFLQKLFIDIFTS